MVNVRSGKNVLELKELQVAINKLKKMARTWIKQFVQRTMRAVNGTNKKNIDAYIRILDVYWVLSG